MVLRLLFLLLSLCSAGLVLLPNAASAETARICLDDGRQALAQFAEFHELATRNLFRTRSVSHEPQPFVNLAADAGRFVGERDGTGLLIFAWDESDLCLFLWSTKLQSQGAYLYVRLPGARGKLTSNARQLSELVQAQMSLASRLPRKRSMTSYDAPQTSSGDLEATVAELSALLFPPDLHGELAQVNHIAIVPVGPIARVPLFMLRPLGDSRAAVDLFSISILTLMEDIQAPLPAQHRSKANALIMGNPVTRDDEWDFPDLPSAEAEARFAHALFAGTMLTREAATIERFEDLAPTADLIVVAAHGVADDEDPLEGSFLALANGRLSPRAIQSLRLDAHPLVVLSACQSGLGRTLDAGVIGLARAFQIAGASSTVMSLWSVDDDATRFLMEHFYPLLAENDPARALQLATAATKQRYPNPAHWAAFAVFGGLSR
jgi:CHAT domain-containing protein